MDILNFLAENKISFTKYDHPAVFTCEDAERMGLKFPGADTKNLFLRDKKGERHFLVVLPHHKQADLKALEKVIGSTRLSMGSPERMMKYLGVEPGSVSILGLINDKEVSVEVIFDESVWNSDQIQCHPLVKTSTVVIPKDGIVKFLEGTGHQVKVINLP